MGGGEVKQHKGREWALISVSRPVHARRDTHYGASIIEVSSEMHAPSSQMLSTCAVHEAYQACAGVGNTGEVYLI